MFSWQNFCFANLWLASFCTPRLNVPVTPGISWLPTFVIHFPIIKRTSFLVLVLLSLVGHHRTAQLQLLWISGWGTDMPYCDTEWFALETNWDHSVIFVTAPKYCISESFIDYEGYPISSSKGFLPAVVDIMVIWIKFAHPSPFYFTVS